LAAGDGGSEAERPWHPDVPPDWAAAMERIAAGDVRRVLVLGPGDAGKSTFCRVLLRHAVRNGRGVALLDADPGQKLVGPPA
jgi:polynucleotide 5'-hydroxyl-kinase GRC3/NOL9